MKIQIDLPEELNKDLKIFKAQEDLQTLQDAAILALTKFFSKKK